MLPNNIDLNLLQVFDAVYGAGSVSAAAEVLKVSQPAVSGALARLREIVDDPLFVRHKGGVTPTARAQTMARPIREALNRLATAISDGAQFDPSETKAEFRMTMIDIVEPILGAHFWNAMQLQAPGLHVQFLPVLPFNFLTDLYADRTHAAIQYFPTKAPHIQSHPLFRIDLVCVGRRGWGDSHGPLDQEAFERAGHATLNESLRSYIPLDRLLASQGHHRHIRCEVSGFWSIAAVVSETDLIATMPRVFADRMSETFGLEQFPCPFDYPDEICFLLWHERNDGNPLQKWLRAIIIDAFKATPYAAERIDEDLNRPKE